MTVNHGVLGSSPRGGASKKATYEIKLVSGFFVCIPFAGFYSRLKKLFTETLGYSTKA